MSYRLKYIHKVDIEWEGIHFILDLLLIIIIVIIIPVILLPAVFIWYLNIRSIKMKIGKSKNTVADEE